MSVNLSIGICEKKAKKLGKYFKTIDFDVLNVNKSMLLIKGDKTIAGYLLIGSKKIPMTISNLNYSTSEGDMDYLHLPEDITKFEREYILETLFNAKTVFWQKYKLGV